VKVKMRALLSLFLIIIIGIGATATASSTTNTGILTLDQIQGDTLNIPPPPSDLFQKILSLVAEIYNYLIGLIQYILELTLLKWDPSLAGTYANILGWLVVLTAIYMILILVDSFKKKIGIIIALGWIFLLAVMFLAR
jgi:small-conductance mechanosensitive channel